MVRFVIRYIIIAAGVLLVAMIPWNLLNVSSWAAAVVFALVLGFVNTWIRPIVQLLALPFSIITLGVVALLINLGFFYLAAALTPGVQTVGFWQSIVAAILIAIVNAVASALTDKKD